MDVKETARRRRLRKELATAAAGTASRIVLVTGAPGSGKTFLVNRSLEGLPGLHFHAPGLADHHQRTLFNAELSRALDSPGLSRPSTAAPGHSWAALLDRALGAPNRVLVLDGLGALVRSNRAFLRTLATAWSRARDRGGVRVLALVDDDRQVLQAVNAKGSPFRDPLESVVRAEDPASWMTLTPLPYAAYDLPTDNQAIERLGFAALFGGRPGILRYIDRARSAGDNYRRLVLDPEGSLWDEPLAGWRGSLKSAGRYGSICAGLAHGARVWAELPEFLGDGISSSSVGPYLKRLVDLSRVRSERSLDAKRGGRGQRYGMADLFDAFWWSAVLPLRSRLISRTITVDAAWRNIEKNHFPDHLDRVFPVLARQFLETSSRSILGADARDAGALWGDGYDIPVAATLRSGAVVYGVTHTAPEPLTDVALDRLEAHMAHTRYGFGREARIRALFSLHGFSGLLAQRAARNPLIRLIGPQDMAPASPDMAPASP